MIKYGEVVESTNVVELDEFLKKKEEITKNKNCQKPLGDGSCCCGDCCKIDVNEKK